MLRLRLVRLKSESVRGIYMIDGAPDRMPDRSLLLSSSAERDYRKIQSWVVVSDMFRSADASLAAVQARRGALAPGYSMHNFGRAIDLDVDATMRNLPGVSRKIDLDVLMEQSGWFCHRTDHLRGKSREHPSDESWHYNHLGVGSRISPSSLKTTAGLADALLRADLGEDALRPDNFECQLILRKLRMYGGAIDGMLGPVSRQAISAFQRAWHLPVTGKIDDRVRRTMAYVGCDVELVG